MNPNTNVNEQLNFNNVQVDALPYIVMGVINLDTPPDNNLIQTTIPRADGKLTIGQTFSSKIIKAQAFIVAPSTGLAQMTYNQLKVMMLDSERPLLVTQGGLLIRYTATLNSVTEVRHAGSKRELSLEFECSTPYGIDVNPITQTFNVGTSPFAFPVVFDGTYYAQPIMTFTISSLSPVQSHTITFGNSQTGTSISLTKTFSAGDTVVIDTLNKNVSYNNAPSDFNGLYPLFRPGQGGAYFKDDATSRSVSAIMTYNRQYM